MTRIEIPFSSEMAIAAICGYKVCTSRSKKYGDIGDIFPIPEPFTGKEYTFRIVAITKPQLDFIKEYYYLLEGVQTPDAFEKLWRKLHRGNYKGQDYYYTHWFARCD